MKKFSFFVFIGLISGCLQAHAMVSDYDTEFATNTRTQPGYFANMANDWRRGITNIVSSPLEIPITVMNYHREDKNPPVIKHAAGFFDGIIRTVARCGSGIWDIVVSFIPGDQEGAPVKPETLF